MAGSNPPPAPWAPVEAAYRGVGAVAAFATCLQRTEYLCLEEGAGASQHRNWPVFDEAPADKYVMPLALELGFLCSSALLLTSLILVRKLPPLAGTKLLAVGQAQPSNRSRFSSNA